MMRYKLMSVDGRPTDGLEDISSLSATALSHQWPITKLGLGSAMLPVDFSCGMACDLSSPVIRIL